MLIWKRSLSKCNLNITIKQDLKLLGSVDGIFSFHPYILHVFNLKLDHPGIKNTAQKDLLN